MHLLKKLNNKNKLSPGAEDVTAKNQAAIKSIVSA